MLFAWPRIPGGKSYYVNGWVGKNGGGGVSIKMGVGGGGDENMSADWRSRYISLKGFHRKLQRRVQQRPLPDNNVALKNFISPVTEGIQLSNIDRNYKVLI